MPRRTLPLAAAAAAAWLLCPTGLGWSKTETSEQLKKTAQVWKQPHNFRVAGSQFAVDSISQGGEQWQVRATERNGSAGLFVTKDLGEEVAYGFNYDSSRSRWKCPDGYRLYSSAISEGEEPEWAVRLEGPGSAPKQISVTGRGTRDVVYDASLGIERRLKRGLFWCYALDAKGRGGWQPWLRQGLGLKYVPPTGDVNAKFTVFQAKETQENQSLSLDWEALLRGRLSGWSTKQGGKILTTDPQYSLRMNADGLDGKVRANAKLGTNFGIDGHVSVEGNYDAEGFGEWKGNKEVANGIIVGADIKATAKKGKVELQPLGVTAVADLGKVAPKFAAEGSTLGLRGRYKLGDDRPSVGAVLGFKPAKVPEIAAAASAQLTQAGDVSGLLKVQAEQFHGVDARYEVSSSKQGPRQAAEVRMPRVDFGGGSELRLTGKFYKGEDWGAKPRVQLGVQYEGKVKVLGKTLDLGGESAGFDSGRSLLDEMGRGWSSPEAQRARNSAMVLRRRVASDFGEARRWLEK